MSPIRDRIVTRLVLLAAITTMVTIAVGTAGYVGTVVWRQQRILAHMPPEASAEMRHLIDGGQRDGRRFTMLYETYRDDGQGRRDPALIRYISVASAMLGGVLAGGVAAIVMARRISRPVAAVTAAAARMAAGDRSIRIDRAAAGEIATLIDSFNTMASEIESYERERVILTAGIAHELRTPLTILKGRLHGLVDGVIEPAAGEADRLLRHVDHLSHLVEDLRVFSHADAGELRMARVVLDLEDVLRGVVADLRPTADKAEVTLDGAYLPVTVIGDILRLTQIFTNILTNAIAHAPRNSAVTIAMRRDGAMIVTDILDEGPGFAPDERSHLFVPFWRGSADRRSGRPGSGLGLALAAKLAQAHGGGIRASNREDRSGAYVQVRLPLPVR